MCDKPNEGVSDWARGALECLKTEGKSVDSKPHHRFNWGKKKGKGSSRQSSKGRNRRGRENITTGKQKKGRKLFTRNALGTGASWEEKRNWPRRFGQGGERFKRPPKGRGQETIVRKLKIWRF